MGFFLYFGSDWLVRGSSSIALNLRVPKAIIGLTLVAFGTSSPELFVNLIAAAKGHTGFSLSNISGSNLANICIGFGICGIVKIFSVNKKEFGIDLIFLTISPLLILGIIFIFDSLIYVSAFLLAVLFIIYLISIKNRIIKIEEIESPKDKLLIGFLFFIAGCVSLYAGGQLVVWGAIRIADILQIDDKIIGLTVVAVGTSIPDIFASVIAIKNNEHSIAIGNILGSNIFNILLVLSGTLLLSEESLDANFEIKIEYGFVFLISLFFVGMVSFSKNFGKKSGIALLFLYIIFLVIRIIVIPEFNND